MTNVRSSDDDVRLMTAALDCAQRGRGLVEPNPMVGAILARDGRELARGWHQRYGGPHAEVEALRQAEQAGIDVRGATLYVTLEPCCHFGKTPPCTDAVIAAGIGRVVAAMQDPDRQVAGKGFARLREAGIPVTAGVCEEQARRLLGPYCKLRTVGRPWVICKWAQTADGFLALPPGRGRWISNERSRQSAHELRGLVDGILVGVQTVLTDDPLLTNRGPNPCRPTRIVLDGSLRTPLDSRLIKTARECPVVIVTARQAVAAHGDRSAQFRQAGAELLVLPEIPGPLIRECVRLQIDLGALLDELGRRRWTHLLVEGGPKVLRQFLHLRLADEIIVYCPASCGLAERIDAIEHMDLPRFDLADVAQRIRLGEPEIQLLGTDVRLRYVLSQ